LVTVLVPWVGNAEGRGSRRLSRRLIGGWRDNRIEFAEGYDWFCCDDDEVVEELFIADVDAVVVVVWGVEDNDDEDIIFDAAVELEVRFLTEEEGFVEGTPLTSPFGILLDCITIYLYCNDI